MSGWTDWSGDVTRRGPIAGFRAWHGIRQDGAMERGLAGGVGGGVCSAHLLLLVSHPDHLVIRQRERACDCDQRVQRASKQSFC